MREEGRIVIEINIIAKGVKTEEAGQMFRQGRDFDFSG